MADSRTLSQIAERQSSDWDRYAGSLRRDAAKAVKQYPDNLAVQSLGDHVPLLLDEIDALRHDIRRAYDIANEYLNDTMRLRRDLAQAIEARRVGTVEQGPVHESAVGSADAPRSNP